MAQQTEIQNQNDILIYGMEYICYKKNKCIGAFMWIDDENIGESWQRKINDNEFEIAMDVTKWNFK